VGKVVSRLMRVVMTPPAVSMPRLEGRDVEQERFLNLLRAVTGEDRGLDGSTANDGLIWIDTSY
jgi:hypothetical protein